MAELVMSYVFFQMVII